MHDHSGDALAMLGQTAIAALVPVAIEWLKKRAWMPWLTENTDTLNRMLSLALAVATTAGFSLSWQGSLAGGGSLHLTIPPVESAARVGWSMLFQEVVYRRVVKPRGYPVPQEPPKV